MPATQVPKSKDFMEWYNEVVELAELTDKRYPIKGMNIWRPYGQRIMSRIDSFTRSEMERTRHDEVSFPLMIPEKLFMKEADQIKGFGKEVFWVTHAGENELPEGEKWVVRPTSECAMYEIFPLWIRAHSDLPLQTYQICNVFRYETKQTRAFMRVREIHFFEDHSVFADEATARDHVELDLAIVKNVYDRIAIPALYSKRPDWDKFPGAVDSTGADVVMPSGRTLQCATVHYYGENFARAYNMTYEAPPEALGKTAFNDVWWFETERSRSGAGGATGLTFKNTIEEKQKGGVRGFIFSCSGAWETGSNKQHDPVEVFVVCEGPHSSNVGQRLRHDYSVKQVVQAPPSWVNYNREQPVESPEPLAIHLECCDRKLTLGAPYYQFSRGGRRYCHQTTYGMSERLVGAVVGCHGDDNGLILPPEIAPIQVVVVPVLFKEGSDAVLAACKEVKQRLERVVWRGRPLSVELDERNKSSGDKFYHWELRGVPLRLEVGPKDVEKKSVFAARRDMPGKAGKSPIPMSSLEEGVPMLLGEIQKALFDRQAVFAATRVKHPKTFEEAQRLDREAQESGVGYILAMPICSDTCAAGVEKGLDIKTLGVPAGQDKAQNVGGTCAVCGKHAKDTLRFARTY